MQLEEMSKEQLIELVKKQETELGEYVAIPLGEFKDAQPVRQPAPVAGPHYEAGRKQGRAEALSILMGLCPETGIDNYTGWSNSGAPEDEGSAHWQEDKLRKLFGVDGELADMMDKAEEQYWKYLGMQDEANRAKNFAANMHGSGKVREVLSKAGEFDLISQLCSAAPVAAPVAGQEPVLWRFDGFGADEVIYAEQPHNINEPGRIWIQSPEGWTPLYAAPVPAASVQAVVLRNPYTGNLRDVRDIESDPAGTLILEPGKPIFSAQQPDSGRDAALAKLVRYGFDGTLGGEFGECDKGPYWMVADVERALAAHPAASVEQGEGQQITHDQVRQIFMASGFTIKDGQADLKDYVYKAAYSLLDAQRALNKKGGAA